MPGRKFSAGSEYRYGFNGHEKSNDVTQGDYTAEYWEYDSRIGRRWNVDPILKEYESPYSTFGGNPVINIDPDGADVINIIWTTTTRKSPRNSSGGNSGNTGLAKNSTLPDIVTKTGNVEILEGKGKDIFKITDINILIDEDGNQTSTSKTTTLELNGSQTSNRYGGRNMLGYSDDRFALAANAPTWLLEYYAKKNEGWDKLAIQSAIAYQKDVPFAAGLGTMTNAVYTISGVYGLARGFLSRNVAGVGFNTFNEFKKAYGSAGAGNAWHHIVEQNPENLAKFGAQWIHNTTNLIKIEHGAGTLHAKVSGYYSSIQPFTNGQTVRKWVSSQTFKQQYDFGIKTLKQFGWTP